MIPKNLASVYFNTFEESVNYYFNVETDWLKQSIKRNIGLLDHSKLSHQHKILKHYSSREEPLLNVFIVGEGNYGKSTLINALVQGNIAPMNFLPTTWCIHRFLFGEKKATAFSKNGTKYHLTIEKAQELIQTEEKKSKENKAYVSELTQIDWHYDDYPILRKITLVDTPGLAQLRTVLADNSIEEFYYKADCVLWLFDATKINSESTLNSVDQVSRYSKKILGVINKWDRISENSRSNILRIANETFGKYLSDIHPVSAIWGLNKNGNYEKSNIPSLLNKIEYGFVSSAKRLSNVQIYNTLKQTILEAKTILDNEIKEYSENLIIYHNNLSSIKDQARTTRNKAQENLDQLNREFVRKMESVINYEITFSNAKSKLDGIERDSNHNYKNMASSITELRNRYYYQLVKNISSKKYKSAKYNYDGTVNLLVEIDNLIDLNPIKTMDNMKITATFNIKLSSILIEKFMSVLEYIPIIGDWIRDSNDRKKRDLQRDIINQIGTQANKNIELLKTDMLKQIEENYEAVEKSFVNQFNKLFNGIDGLNMMINDAKSKHEQLKKSKYMWATAIAQTIKTGELYAEIG